MRDDAKSQWRMTPTLRARARSLRRGATDAEKIVWNCLRAHRLNGASFRRQTPIGPYIADFVCHAAQLVIELDGGQHYDPAQQRRDAQRTAYFEARGFRVIRFSNLDVIANRSGILESILAALNSTPSPTLPRKREREHADAPGEKE